MSEATRQLEPALQSYLHAVSLREPGPCRELRERTRWEHERGGDLISSPEQVQLLALIARMLGAWRVLEVGTFTGYTTLWLGLELGEDVRFVCLDRDRDATTIARAAWDAAGIGERVELRLGEAADGLAALLDEGHAAGFDLAYIDADKESLVAYYEDCLRLLRPGGLVAIDNTLWGGSVADESDQSASTRAVRTFNETVHADERVDLSLVPIGDGMTLARKRE